MARLKQAGLAVVVYAIFWQWRMRLLAKAARTNSTIGPQWLALLTCRVLRRFASLIGVNQVSETGHENIDRSRRYMITWHPHGFIVFCPILLLAEKSILGEPQGRPWNCTGAPAIFKLPFVGELLTLINGRPVDRRSLESIVSQGGTVAIQPGGVAEQAATRHDQEQAFFPAKLGFVRLAIKGGTPLLMVYVFGENQLYKKVDGLSWLTKRIRAVTGLTLPIWTGRWGIPQNFFPRTTNVHVRWGNSVEVGPADPDPSEERVEEVFQRYLVELQRLFYTHCNDCLPREVAARGLKIVRLDGKRVPDWRPSSTAAAAKKVTQVKQPVVGAEAEVPASAAAYSRM